MPLPEKYNQVISLDQAATLTAKYRATMSAADPKGGALWKESLEKVLSQPGCVAVRCYFGRRDDQSLTVVIIGVDGEGNDMVDGIIIEDWFPCPPFCSTENRLSG